MHGEEQQRQIETEAQPPVLDYAMARRARSAWVLLFVLGLMLSFLHLGFACCLLGPLLVSDEAPYIPYFVGSILVLVTCLPLYLLTRFGLTGSFWPTGILLVALNSCLYGFAIVLFIHWLRRRRMRRM